MRSRLGISVAVRGLGHKQAGGQPSPSCRAAGPGGGAGGSS